MPRSHRMTSRFPPLRMYSAAESVSSMVEDMPRLSSTGFAHLAEFFEHHEVLHVARADLQHIGPLGDRLGVAHIEDLGDDGQVDRVTSRAKELQTFKAMPWNAYGLVRGLYAPAAKHRGPGLAAIASAALIIWDSDSIEHGPAMTATAPPPRLARPTRTTVSSGWNSRVTSL